MDDAKFLLVGAKKYSCVAKGWNRNRNDTESHCAPKETSTADH